MSDTSLPPAAPGDDTADDTADDIAVVDAADSPEAFAEAADGEWHLEDDHVVLQDRYVIGEVLGSGGMATVHRAHDRVLDRDVAVKVLHTHLNNDGPFLDSFLREAQSAASLTHPNVVTVFDFHVGDPSHLVLELVDGSTVRKVLDARGRVSPPEALALLGPALAGIGAAHDHGLVHRDIKPENLLIRRDGVVKVADFGLAKAAAASTVTTHAGGIAGSARYMAPEVATGEPASVASDVYALGVVLYELLTGTVPFEGDTPAATAAMHTTSRISAPSALVPGLPGAVDNVVAQATDPRPDKRPHSAAQMLAALQAAIPAGPSPVDMRDGSANQTIVIPVAASHTTIVQPAQKRRFGRRRVLNTSGPASSTSVQLRGHTAALEHPDGLRVNRKVLRATALAIVAAVLGWALWTQVLFPVSTPPTVATQPVAEALDALRGEGYIVASRSIPEYSPTVAAGAVVRVEPQGSIGRGTELTLVVSRGPRAVDMPLTAGLTGSEAEQLLVDAGFTVDVRDVFDDDVPEGFTVATTPGAGIGAAREGQSVVLEVSRGREPIEVPGIIGSQIDRTLVDFASLGLDVEVIDERHDDQLPQGAIIDQVPTAGTTLLRGDSVQVVVSLGARPFAMPDVSGQVAGAAQEALEGLGLTVNLSEIDTEFSDRRDRVARTSPPAGSDVASGDTVTMFVYR